MSSYFLYWSLLKMHPITLLCLVLNIRPLFVVAHQFLSPLYLLSNEMRKLRKNILLYYLGEFHEISLL